MSDEKEPNFFEKFGLEVAQGEVEVGGTYPIYGMITKFLNEEPGSVVVELNYSITANLNVTEEEKVEVLRTRAFEPGIFVSKVVSKDEDNGIVVDCSMVVFGKQQNEMC